MLEREEKRICPSCLIMGGVHSPGCPNISGKMRTPYQAELRSDARDFEIWHMGLDAMFRLSGMTEDEQMAALSAAMPPEQLKSFTKRIDRMDEFYKLDPAKQKKALGME